MNVFDQYENEYIKTLVDAKKLDISLQPDRWKFDDNPYIISGPCSVESEDMIVDWAVKMKEVGVNALRGGAYKPCTYPITEEVGSNGWKEGLRKEGLELLDVDPELKQISPVRYRAILKTTEPQKIINSLQAVDTKSIIPTDEYIVSENQSLFPNSSRFTKETLSLPIYPSLTNSEIDIILSVLVKK